MTVCRSYIAENDKFSGPSFWPRELACFHQWGSGYDHFDGSAALREKLWNDRSELSVFFQRKLWNINLTLFRSKNIKSCRKRRRPSWRSGRECTGGGGRRWPGARRFIWLFRFKKSPPIFYCTTRAEPAVNCRPGTTPPSPPPPPPPEAAAGARPRTCSSPPTSPASPTTAAWGGRGPSCTRGTGTTWPTAR